MATFTTFDPKELETKVKDMYRSVAENPHGEFHFEMEVPFTAQPPVPAGPDAANTALAGPGTSG